MEYDAFRIIEGLSNYNKLIRNGICASFALMGVPREWILLGEITTLPSHQANYQGIGLQSLLLR